MKKSIEETVGRTRYQVQPYVKEAGNEGFDDEGFDDVGLDVEGRDDAQPMDAEAREHQHHAPGVQGLPPA